MDMEKKDQDLRNKVLTMRLTNKEMELIKKSAKEAGIPTAMYARIATMRAAKRDAMRADDDSGVLLL